MNTQHVQLCFVNGILLCSNKQQQQPIEISEKKILRIQKNKEKNSVNSEPIYFCTFTTLFTVH